MESREFKGMFKDFLDKKNIKVLGETIINGYFSVIVDYSSLDEYNKICADSLVFSNFAQYDDETKMIIFSGYGDQLIGILGKFEYQDILYGFKTVPEILAIINQYKNESNCNEIDFYLEDSSSVIGVLVARGLCPETCNLYFDKFEEKFWDNADLYERHAKYKDSVMKKCFEEEYECDYVPKLA